MAVRPSLTWLKCTSKLTRPAWLLAAAAVAAALASPASASAAAQTCGGTGSSDNGDRRASRRRDLRDPVPGRQLERHAVPLQPRLRRARRREPGTGRRRPGDRRVAARPWLRAGRLVLLDHRLGYRAGAARPDRHAEPVRPLLWPAEPDDRLGPFARRHHYRRPDPALPERFTAALPMCGVLSGGVATWNTALDSAFAFQQLLAAGSGLQVVNITSPQAQPRDRRDGRRAGAGDPGRPGRGSRWLPRSATRLAGSRRCRPSPASDRLRGAGSQPVPLGHPGGLPVRLRTSGPTLSTTRAATRPGLPASTSLPSWSSRPTTPKSSPCTRRLA